MANIQQADDEIQAYSTAMLGVTPEEVGFSPSEETLLCDTSIGQLTPLVSTAWHCQVFDAVHGLL